MIGAIVIMVAIAVAALLVGMKWQRDSRLPDRNQQNIDILRQEFVELKARHDAGELNEADYKQAYDELVVTLGTDLQSEVQPTARPPLQVTQGKTLIAAFILLAVLAPSLYYVLGNPAAINAPKMSAADAHSPTNPHAAANDKNLPTIEVMVDRLRKKLEENPNNPEGWLMLGRSYMTMNQYAKAVDALTRAYSQNSNDPSILLAYADALAMQNGGIVDDKGFKLIQRVLEIKPNEPSALWMAAMAYEGKQDLPTAIAHWKRLLSLVEANPNDYREVQMRLAQAEARLTGNPLVLPPAHPPMPMAQATPNTPVAAPASGASVTAVIKLDDRYKQRVNADDTVFVFARAVNGPRQPLAAKRLQVKDLPATIKLDDSMAMSPMNKLSDHAQVLIGARVSRTGNVMPSTGDPQGSSDVVETKKQGQTVQITINQEVM